MTKGSDSSKPKEGSPEGSGAGSGSDASASAKSPVGSPTPEDFTFGQPVEVKVDSGTASEVGTTHEQEVAESHDPDVLESVQGPVIAESIMSGSHESTHTHPQSEMTVEPENEVEGAEGLQPPLTPTPAQSMPIPAGPSAPHGDPSFISSAHESFITRPTIGTTSDETAKTPSSFGDAHHMHGQGNTFGPA